MGISPLLERLHERAHRAPVRPALADRDREVTFAQLRDEIASCAAFLRACGVGEGAAVGLLLPNGIPFVAALLSIAHAGGVAILLPDTGTADELRQHCKAAGTRVVLTGAPHGRLVEAAGGRALRQRHQGLLPFAFGVPSSEGLVAGDFIVQLTSGTDRPPKLAIRTHASVWSEIQDFAEEVALSARDTILVLPSIFHSYGLIGGTLAPLCWGARVMLGERLPPAEVLRLVRRDRATILFAVPVMYRALATARVGNPRDLASLRLCLSAGAPLPRDVDDRFARRYGRRICQDYGSTEAGVISLRLEWTSRLAGSVGRPLRHRTVTIVGASGEPLGPGQVGDVVVRSPALARAYLGAPLPSGFMTGDLGWVDEEGYLFLSGRKSSLISAGGGVVDPAAVEAAIAALPGVREVAVVGVPGPPGDERVKAVVVGEGLTAARVLRHCHRCLDGSQIPEVIEFCDALPRTPAGKVLLRALRASGGATPPSEKRL